MLLTLDRKLYNNQQCFECWTLNRLVTPHERAFECFPVVEVYDSLSVADPACLEWSVLMTSTIAYLWWHVIGLARALSTWVIWAKAGSISPEHCQGHSSPRDLCSQLKDTFLKFKFRKYNWNFKGFLWSCEDPQGLILVVICMALNCSRVFDTGMFHDSEKY